MTMTNETLSEKARMSAIGTVTYLADPVVASGREYVALLTLACSGNWQPCAPERQFRDNKGAFLCGWSSHVIMRGEKVVFRGLWPDFESAEQFARSMGDRSVRAVAVEPYLYCPVWGVVPTT